MFRVSRLDKSDAATRRSASGTELHCRVEKGFTYLGGGGEREWSRALLVDFTHQAAALRHSELERIPKLVELQILEHTCTGNMH